MLYRSGDVPNGAGSAAPGLPARVPVRAGDVVLVEHRHFCSGSVIMASMEPEEWSDVEIVRVLTRLLRTDEDSWLWRRLRELLEARHVALSDAALAFSVEQGNDSEFGIIVTRQADVFEYSIVKDDEAEWLHMPDWTESPYGQDVRRSLDLLRDERSDGSSSRTES